jgi:hypothetical protein
MLTDAHTKMDMPEFLEALAVTAEMRVQNSLRALRIGSASAPSPAPAARSSTAGSSVASTTSLPSVAESDVEPLEASDATPVVAHEGSAAHDDAHTSAHADEPVEPKSPAHTALSHAHVTPSHLVAHLEPDSGSAKARTQTGTISSQAQFNDEIAYVLARVCVLGKEESKDPKAWAKAAEVTEVMRAGSASTLRKFKGGGVMNPI